MVEITHKGAWIKWSTLDTRDKGWFILATVAAVPVGMVIGVPFGEILYQLGFYLGSDGGTPDPRHLADLVESRAYRYLVLAAFAFALVSGLAWWRFSLHQDELFNRIQNYAIGRAGGWSLAGATGWWLLSFGGWAGPFPLGLFVLASLALLLVFWFHAVHKWA